MRVKVSAPASLMLMGEYAVLQGYLALVCAVDKRMTVIMSFREDNIINIESTALGSYSTRIDDLSVVKPFQFVLAVLKKYQTQLKCGLDILITANFSTTIGFGSSSAVTVATLKALTALLNISLSPLALLVEGRTIVQAVQGRGSGADVAAAVYGGVVGYRMQEMPSTTEDCFATLAMTAQSQCVPYVEIIPHTFPLVALYAGFKTPTADAIKLLQTRFAKKEVELASILNAIGECAEAGFQYAKKANWSALGGMMIIQQGLMQDLGVSLPVLDALVQDLCQQPGILGAKISGSGLGDCVIGLGEVAPDYQFQGDDAGVYRIPVAISQLGVQCEQI